MKFFFYLLRKERIWLQFFAGLLVAVFCFAWFVCVRLFSSPAVQHHSLFSVADTTVTGEGGFKIAPGLEASLYASEPMLINPTNMDIDAKGRVWVCEALNYRNKLNPKNPYRKAGDRILILEDTNHDGKADTAKVFYQGEDVNAALGIAVLGNKVIVSCSPNVFVFTDENGDDRADKKELLFTGIGGEQHDHAIHAFTFGPDGKYYFNFGNAGDSIFDKNGKAIVDKEGNVVNGKGKPYRQGMVFRCNPDGSEFEVLGNNFRNNYEVAVDSYGSLWQSDNDDDGNRGVRINYVMEFGNYGYTDEMTGASWGTRRINMEDSIPYRHWHLNDPGVVPNLLQTGAGSPTGMVVYEGSLLPAEYHNQIIHADAGPKVVRAYPIHQSGAGYTATIKNIMEGTGDSWFRPSDVCVAPDGSLFVADWYDPGVGGHQMGDVSHGRIYRIAPAGNRYTVPSYHWDDQEEVINALKSPNLAIRYLAWQKLHAWGTKAEHAMATLFHDRTHPRFSARACWLLSKLPSKGMHYVQEALKSDWEDLRITGIRAARQLNVDMIAIVQQMINDPSPQVRRELLIALCHNNAPEAPALWARLAGQYDGRDRWYLEALGISADQQWDAFFAAWLQQVGNRWNTPAGRDIVWRARTKQALPLLAQIIEDPATDIPHSLKYFRAFDFHHSPEKQQVLLSLMQGKHPQQALITKYALLQIDADNLAITPVLKKAIDQTLDRSKGTLDYVDLLAKYNIRDRDETLLMLMKNAADNEVKVASARLLLKWNGQDLIRHDLHKEEAAAMALINTLGRFEDRRGKDLLQEVVLDKSFSLGIRKQALQMLGRGWSGEDRLIQLARNRQLSPELESVAALALTNAYRSSVRDSAAKYLVMPKVNDGKPLPPLAELVALRGNVQAGQEVFATYCSSCHMVRDQGTNFGPNLTEIGSKLSRQGIYTAIMNPDEGISFGFEGYVFSLKNGTQLLGLVSSETSDEIEIKMMGGIVEKHKKSELISRKPFNSSLMPSNLQQAMTQEQLVNLVEYLSSLKKTALSN